jgi:pilus assembly protein TadC
MKFYTPIIIRLVPRNMRQKLADLLNYSNIRTEPDDFIGFMVMAGLVISLVGAYVSFFFNLVHPLIGLVATFLAVEAMLYLFVTFSVDSKTRAVEEVLPDALQLMSSNIRAGLTTDKALLLAARPEFGPLADELRRVGRETMTGRNFAYALSKTTKRIKSESLNRTIDLIVNSMKSGGKLADLLDQTANDLRDQDMVKKEISAGVLMYVIFIFVAIALGAPLLFSMSSFLVKLLTQNLAVISEGMPSGGMSGAPISLSNSGVSANFIGTYSLIALTVSSTFGSVIIGLILKGDNRYGLRYLPLMLLIAIGLFFAGSYVMDMFFGSMMVK